MVKLFRIGSASAVIAALVMGSALPAQVVTSEFGTRDDPFHGKKRAHKGMDLAAPTGTPVHATGNGVVTYAGWKGSYGLLVVIRHPSGYETRFAHLSKVDVGKGQSVRKGSMIGRIGSTGRSTGPHLHYEVRLNGKALDPSRFM
ncbi:M23 family metallopeptidase [Croceicoccus gelatinilyticus]|uniref:M23 family metallopeptidase n=1 Tax=Croceicoccus gelatinilyticus TaxID=2835536 RepID=UPI001BCB8EB2|nr:M23 family metallopeptidase [Croceicoccus gelatinilyticus]MBS7671382.1 M23 family metallopeptidase [Croceicoccus gelatinilyticus]